MERDPLKEEPEAEVNGILIPPQKELILLRGLTHHPERLIVLQQELIHLHHVVGVVPEEQQVEEVTQEAAEVEGDNKMKKYFLPTAFIILMITVTGCYTVAWDPGDNNFPTKDNSLQTSDSLYAQSGYDLYDNSPWWWEITPPSFDDTYDSDQDVGTVTTIYVPYIPPFNPPPVGRPIVRPPVHEPTPVNPTDNKDKSQNVRPRDNTNNNSNKARNDNGSRNTDTGRKR